MSIAPLTPSSVTINLAMSQSLSEGVIWTSSPLVNSVAMEFGKQISSESLSFLAGWSS